MIKITATLLNSIDEGVVRRFRYDLYANTKPIVRTLP